MGAGEPANQATQWLAPPLPVFAGMPAPTASARAFSVSTRQLRSQDPGLRRFIGKPQLNTIFAICAASLVWPQATAVPEPT
ncbi:hypothetical protein EGJ22_02550 [Pseudomonas sp. p99-361]|nr:hypothetical protein HV87_17550 [Pseudomonas aeruginosa]QEQ87790.1 hypothetical protein F1602_10835 [Pseudomonas putida]RRV23577.1 hypothetical protein EGJ22_02550 [Pseudomonas sp. p99-361]